MSIQPVKNHYETLQIALNATPEEIKQAYRDMAVVWHPDRFPNSPRLQGKAQEAMKQINAAYETLSDPEKRRQYDASSLKQEAAHTYQAQTSTRKSPEQPRSRKTTYSARPSASPPQMSEQARAEAFKRVQRWVKLVEVVVNVQRQFGIVLSVPAMLMQGAKSACDTIRRADYQVVNELVADADVKFELLLSHANRALEKELATKAQAVKQAQLAIDSEKKKISVALNRVHQTHAKVVEASLKEREALSASPAFIGCAATTVLPVFFFNFIVGFIIVVAVVSLCCLLQTIHTKQANKSYELAVVRAEVRNKLDGEQIIQQSSSRLLELEEGLRIYLKTRSCSADDEVTTNF